MGVELNAEEKAAIADLKRVAKKWPKSLWLFSASGILSVMKKSEDGQRVSIACGEGYDPEMVVGAIPIENDGGDW